ncbi:MAG: hypothetical protein WBC83_03655 [Minisyncoccia bacterium]
MARIKVVEPMNVHTKNSVYRVEPICDGGAVLYKATKIETIKPSKQVSVEESITGRDVYLELGHRMILGRIHTSSVVAVEYIEPHH